MYEKLLSPCSVSVIGASDSEGNRGGSAVGFLLRFGFEGKIFPVHPSAGQVRGLKVWPRIADLPEAPDLAVIGLGAARVKAAVEECVELGTRNFVVWAGGFREAGPEGREREWDLAEFCRANAVNLIGPNSLGLINTSIGLTGTFASWLNQVDEIHEGAVAIVSQSGGLGATVHHALERAGIGVKYYVSTGNEAVTGLVDVVEALADEDITAIALYIEGLAEGRRFLGAVSRARDNGKHVVVLKGGGSPSSARAAAAHTGALVGSRRVWKTLLARERVVQVRTIEELVDVTGLMSQPGFGRPQRGAPEVRPDAPRAAIVCFGGGMGVLAADHAEEAGMAVPKLSEALRARLAALAPDIATVSNPLDLTPEMFTRDEWRGRFFELVGAVFDSGEVDCLVVLGGAMARGAEDIAAQCVALSKVHPRLAVSWPLAPPRVREILSVGGMYVFDAHADAIGALARVLRSGGERLVYRPEAARDDTVPEEFASRAGASGVLTEVDAHRLLGSAGLPGLPGRPAHGRDEALAAAEELGFPVALKIVSESVLHRATAGLVHLDLGSPSEVEDAYQQIAAHFREGDYVYVQKMAAEGGREVFLSASRDSAFGVVIGLGRGGVNVEQIDDLDLFLAPMSIECASRAAREIGLVSEEETDEAALVGSYVSCFSHLMSRVPATEFTFEVNPLWVTRTSIYAVDALGVVNGSGEEEQ